MSKFFLNCQARSRASAAIFARMFSSPSIHQSARSIIEQKGDNKENNDNSRDLNSKAAATTDDKSTPSSTNHVVLKRVEGSPGCFNDVIVFPHEPRPQENATEHLTAKCNFVFFGGDIQDYPEEMQKNPTSRMYVKWNLVDSGRLLAERLNASPANARANLFVVRADTFHLKCFANYSNFVPSTCFGVPLSGNELGDLGQKKTISKLNLVFDEKHGEHAKTEGDHSHHNSGEKSVNEDESQEKDPLRCWNHLKLLIDSSIDKYNHQNGNQTNQIDAKLPIVLCAFSKGCIVLNELCSELVYMKSVHAKQHEDEDDAVGVKAKKTDTAHFVKQIRDLVWLDGGHCGTSNAWITSGDVVDCIKEAEIACFVFVTPYQMKSSKQWAVEEYKKFIELLKAHEVKLENEYYFQEKEEDYDIDVHFEILGRFNLDRLLN